MGAIGHRQIRDTLSRIDPAVQAEMHEDVWGGKPAFRVTSYRSLVRLIGFCQYNSRGHLVLLRGQRKCDGSLLPNAYRDQRTPAKIGLDEFIDECRTLIDYDPQQQQRLTTEPMLGHYGIRTRWLDAVDSIPHALFFACYQLVPPSDPETPWTFRISDQPNGFIHVLDCGVVSPYHHSGAIVPGLWTSNSLSMVCDLRRAKPSNILRPHAQHGWLVKGCDDSEANDLWHRVYARIVFETRQAVRWLGKGDALSPSEMFPAPWWDLAYGTLLKQDVTDLVAGFGGRKTVGEIQRFAGRGRHRAWWRFWE